MDEFPARATLHPEIVPSRWTLMRDVAVFQLKLLLDGLRDALLLPISLFVALLDVLGIGPRAGRQFYALLEWGRRTEYWINLFGATDHVRALTSSPRPGVDALVDRLERLAVQEYERGGITASTKDAVDRALDHLTRRGPSDRDPPGPLP
ncbi:MAG: hypothetical protein F4Z72_04155 [Gemmatimonadales bacterium]|uniref:hypothetical protein n=1 Tax=Candidatus Palauibacter irciniicola TaxID=3056733 RepID=UPI00137FF16E|nr:hypothetical protein [Candidatus Palauibacter irciniicola]MYC17844.1 hypothetical protein [Gemmatimonadales bacterium]